ncbi:MAG TPA: hypothetical protein PLE81_03810 [Brevundimonas sp.]|jgi:hypothetical protein|uniref:hypothetical protein n=1 Tax=Brevundimonas sp. TaxID=1871086 RepID=UPI002BBE95B5|nr:hypothetical protein [Brevundimonas sp.]HRH19746.1 hypothetical protein [Brevundimonas sp.]
MAFLVDTYGRLIRIPVIGPLVRAPVMLVKFLIQPVPHRETASAEALRDLTDGVGALRERVDELARELARLRGDSSTD